MMALRQDWMTRRSLLHISMILFALLIGRTPDWFISFMCFAAILFNLFILPRITSNKIRKRDEVKLGFSLGLISYPASLFILSLFFQDYLVFMMIGWSMMAFGDGGASLIGRAWKRQGNKELDDSKSVIGSIGFLLLAIPFSFLMLLQAPKEILLGLDTWHWLLILVISAVVSMTVERYKYFIDDNVAVSFSGALVSWALYMVFSFGWFQIPNDTLLYVAAIMGVAVLAYAFKAMDLKGALVGIFIALAIWLGIGLGGIEALFVFLLLGSIASRIKSHKKSATGYPAYQSSSRSWRNAISNAGPAALMGLLAWMVPDMGPFLVAGALTSLSVALSDTLSSEIGTAFGRRFYDLKTFKASHPGPDGVFSILGLFVGLMGAMVIPLMFYIETNNYGIPLMIFIGGFTGNLIDTVLGAWPQRMGLMNNHSVNFASTLIAGSSIALYLYYSSVIA